MQKLVFFLLGVFLALAVGSTAAQPQCDGVLSSPLVYACSSFPNMTVWARKADGSLYTAQYISFSFVSLSLGFWDAYSIPTSFTPNISYATQASMVTHEAKNDTVVMLDGSVAARQALYNHGTLPNGVNFTTIYEIYNISGQIPWGPRVVNITANQIKYSAIVAEWDIVSPNNGIQLLINFSLVTGSFYPPASFTPGLVSGGYRAVEVSWAAADGFNVALQADLWAVLNGTEAIDLHITPNPILTRTSPVFEIVNGTNLNRQSSLFGFILPPYVNTVAWDPAMLVNLFEGDEPPAGASGPESHVVAIAAGVAVPGVLLVTAALASAWFLYQKKTTQRDLTALRDLQSD